MAYGSSNDLLVWQTYAHKTELRPNGTLTVAWDSLGEPTYQNAYTTPLSPGAPGARLNLWNNLDEDSEIGSCQIIGQYTKQPEPRAQKSLILFEAKVNRDEYEYLRTNYPDQNIGNTGAGASATDCDETTSGRGRLCQAQLRAKKQIKAEGHSYYPNGGTDTCKCPVDQAICLPCGSDSTDGAIEVKAAWRRLLPSENAADYYTSTALYYQNEYDPATKKYQYRYYNDTFALIGLHIIRKLENYPDFVFTTFEHVGEASADDQYVVTDSDGAEVSPATRAARQATMPNTDRNENHAIPVEISDVNREMRDELGRIGTVWKNYQLAGVQAQVDDCQVSSPSAGHDQAAGLACIRAQDKDAGKCLGTDSNYYMANLFVETDPFLNNFSGPGFGGNPFSDCRNTVYQGKTHNMGGCKGCHGVAQTAFGTDFSFLLDFGNGKPGIAPDTLKPPSAKLENTRIYATDAQGNSVGVNIPGSSQACRLNAGDQASGPKPPYSYIKEGCFDFCEQKCETNAAGCQAYYVNADGCDLFPPSSPALSVGDVDGYVSFLLPGTRRPPPHGKTSAPQPGFPARYLERNRQKLAQMPAPRPAPPAR